MNRKRTLPFGIAIGVAIGIAIGVALESIPLGVGVGLVFVAGALIRNKRNRESEDGS